MGYHILFKNLLQLIKLSSFSDVENGSISDQIITKQAGLFSPNLPKWVVGKVQGGIKELRHPCGSKLEPGTYRVLGDSPQLQCHICCLDKQAVPCLQIGQGNLQHHVCPVLEIQGFVHSWLQYRCKRPSISRKVQPDDL